MVPQDQSEGIAPRRAALRLLQAVMAEGRLMPELVALTEGLSPPDRARAQRLAASVLRGLPRADRMIAPHLSKRPPLFVQNALRLGVTELAEGAAAHGVVNDIVTIVARDKRHATMKGLVNAVLRKCSADAPARWAALPVPRLPDWLRRPLVEAWSRPVIERIEIAHFAGPALDLTPRTDADALVAQLESQLGAQVGTRLLPTGSVRVTGPVQVTALPGYAEGDWWVQDAAAALPAQLLDARPGERVLDLCAAPGGKTLQMAAAGAEVTALDLSAQRLERLTQNLERTGLKARIVTGDALEFNEGGWDAILLDAPCSATGTIRRHPDLPHAKDGAGFSDLIALQERMIDHALGLLRSGGRLVFCTCSLLPDEGEVQIEEALARHPGLAVEPLDLPGIAPEWISQEGGLRLRPDFWVDLGGMDGFYMARLRKA